MGARTGNHAARAATAAALILALLSACGPADPAAHAEDRDGWRPDLLVLVVDCLRRDRIEPRPDGTVLMPNVRALAAEGTTFTQAYAQASWTRPSVAAMLYADRIGARLAIGWTMGAVVSALGMYLSVSLDLPTGATMVCTFGLVLIAMAALRPLLNRA